MTLPMKEIFWRGFFSENPVFRLALSLCPAVAVTNAVKNGLLMGVAVLGVQILSSGTVALVRRWIHEGVRIPVYTIIIALWVSVIDRLLASFFPEIYAEIGLYIKLIVAFAIIISRLEVFASKNSLGLSMIDGLAYGIGFLFALVLISAFREVLGNGSFFGLPIVEAKPILLFALPTGGFFIIGLLMAAMNWIDVRRGVKLAEEKRHAA